MINSMIENVSGLKWKKKEKNNKDSNFILTLHVDFLVLDKRIICNYKK